MKNDDGEGVGNAEVGLSAKNTGNEPVDSVLVKIKKKRSINRAGSLKDPRTLPLQLKQISPLMMGKAHPSSRRFSLRRPSSQQLSRTEEVRM